VPELWNKTKTDIKIFTKMLCQNCSKNITQQVNIFTNVSYGHTDTARHTWDVNGRIFSPIKFSRTAAYIDFLTSAKRLPSPVIYVTMLNYKVQNVTQ